MHLSHTLGQAGEHYVIGEIIAAAPSALNGDDAAVMYPATPNSRTVASTDMMVEGRHFRRDWSTPNEIGQKAILRNFADVEAMGARPTAALLAIAAPADTPVNFVRGIAEGIGLRCAFYNAELVGGDLTRSKELVITVTAIGSLGGSQEPWSCQERGRVKRWSATARLAIRLRGLRCSRSLAEIYRPNTKSCGRLSTPTAILG